MKNLKPPNKGTLDSKRKPRAHLLKVEEITCLLKKNWNRQSKTIQLRQLDIPTTDEVLVQEPLYTNINVTLAPSNKIPAPPPIPAIKTLEINPPAKPERKNKKQKTEVRQLDESETPTEINISAPTDELNDFWQAFRELETQISNMENETAYVLSNGRDVAVQNQMFQPQFDDIDVSMNFTSDVSQLNFVGDAKILLVYTCDILFRLFLPQTNPTISHLCPTNNQILKLFYQHQEILETINGSLRVGDACFLARNIILVVD